MILVEIHEHAHKLRNIAFEIILSGRVYVRLIPGWQKRKLFFLRLDSPELAIARVYQRVKVGGHNIPEPVIRRRFKAGLHNLENLYKPLVDEWVIYDNSGIEPKLLEESI